MGLSNDLLSQFAKITNDKTKNKKESTTYGTVKVVGGVTYVQLDGSDLLTPYSSTADVKDGDRVQVAIKNHNATITGNLSSPSARTDDVQELAGQVTEVNTLVAKKVDTEVLETEKARIDKLVADNVTITGKLTANEGYISELQTEMLEVNDTLTAKTAEIESLKTDKANVDDLTAIHADIDDLEAKKATIEDLTVTNAEISKLKVADAEINTLVAGKLSATDADLKYANIDFTNIGKAAMENFYANSGLIKDVVVVGDQKITGHLIGVTISGDLIDAGTVKADKLVVLGKNGLYYKLNVDSLGETTAESDPKYQTGLDGSVIIAKSITATEISVDDLVAFDATIGGFKITDNSIYSGVKETVNNATRGVYLDNTGQIAFGDASNFIKFYKDENGVYKLDISARQITFGASNTSVEDVATAASKAVVKSVDHYYLSDSPTSLVGGSWGNTAPSWTDGKYIWHRSFITYGDGSTEYTPSENGVCITGNTGPRGLQGLQGEKGDQGIPGSVGETGPKGDKGDKGDTGEAGQNGKTSYFHIKYSSVSKPTTASQMTETPSKYIGTYVDFTEADSTNPSKYTWSQFEGAQGEQGIPGTNGANGKTSYLHIKYSNDGGSTFTANNGETPGDYIGQCTDFNSSDPTTVSSYTWSKIKGEKGDQGIQGLQGEKGEQGIPGTNGTNGTNGKTSYFHIKYSSVDNPTSSSQMTETPSTYIGTYVDYTSTDSTDPKKYTWSRFQGAQGEKGDKGIPGTNGTNGKTSYLHIAYANSADGKTGFDASTSTNKLYIGQYTDFTSEDSTDPTKYSWTKIKGETGAQGPKGDTGAAGKGISKITNYYLATASSAGVTASTSGWTEAIQNVSSSKKYLWNYEKITYTDSTTASTLPCIIGAYGDAGAQGPKGDTGATGATGSTGATGNGISSISEYYAVSTSNSNAPTSWSTTVPTLTATNKYMWNYETITYTNGSTKDTSKRVIGVYGDKGATGATGATGPKGPKGDAGTDAISITITASNGTIFKNNSGSTTLTAHVYKGGVEQSITDAGVCGTLGSIKWYKGTSTTSVATAKTLTVTASDVTNYMAITCQLEK